MKKNFLFFSSVLFLLFFLKSYLTLDPDFGWHIKMGQLILHSGIPKIDPFSFSMSNYPFIDHEWLFNVVTFLLYKGVGYGGLSLIFSAVVFWTLYLLTRSITKKLDFFYNSLTLLVSTILFEYVGVRPQVIGWAFLIYWIILLKKKKNSWVLLALQILWVNIHGSFFLGVGTYFLYEIINYIELRKINIKKILTFITLMLSTIVNPYGIKIWKEVWMQLSDIGLGWRIGEWRSSLVQFNLPFWIYAIFFLSLFLFFYKNKKFLLTDKIVSGIFLLISIKAVRNIPLFIIVSFPPILFLWKEFLKQIKTEKAKSFFIIKRAISSSIMFIILSQIINICFQYKSIETLYPIKAAHYLQQNNIKGQIFNHYDWGGYLVWKNPSMKVYIDGRMPSWRWTQNDNNKSNNVFQEYESIMSMKESPDRYIKKYNLTYALTKNNEIDKKPFEKYKKIYDDSTSVIYQLQ